MSHTNPSAWHGMASHLLDSNSRKIYLIISIYNLAFRLLQYCRLERRLVGLHPLMNSGHPSCLFLVASSGMRRPYSTNIWLGKTIRRTRSQIPLPYVNAIFILRYIKKPESNVNAYIKAFHTHQFRGRIKYTLHVIRLIIT